MDGLVRQLTELGVSRWVPAGKAMGGVMVVVEDGRNLINKTLNVTVTKVLQTSAGRMIFAKP